MRAKSKTPQIRFKGFSGEWEEKTLESISEEISYGLTIRPQFITDGIPLISARELKNGYIDYKIAPRISKIDYDKLSEKAKGKKGDLFLTKTGTIGLSAYVSEDTPMAITQNISFIRITNEIFNHQFILQTFKTKKFYNSAISKVNQSTIMDLQLQDIRKLSIYFPDKLEQINVSNYFQKLDKLIEQKEKKYQKLKQFKKAMLDKMFPKNGADTPEIRFKGFSGKWEEKSLEEIVDRYDNLRIPISASNRIAGDTPYYGANGIQDYVQGFTHDGEFILVAEDGANDLKNYPVQYVNGKIWVNNHAHVLQAKKDISSNKFLKYSISKINIEPFLVGGGRAKLNANIMMKINIYVPLLELQEQEKIGNYFQKLDSQIDLQQKELEKLKNIKKASLAKMFV